MKCPACNAELTPESGREFIFCSYCGTKVLITNDNEQIIRNIDEARIKEAETDRMVKLKQLEMVEKNTVSMKKIYVGLLIAAGVLIALGILGFTFGNEGMMVCLSLGLALGIFTGLGIMIQSEENKPAKLMRTPGENEIRISCEMTEVVNTDVRVAELLFKESGFKNVTVVPIRDVNLFSLKQEWKVITVTIAGNSEFEEDDIFSNEARVLITYHSR